VKVIDFGLAKSTLHSAKTHPSLLVGKFLYMSPEQARHQPVDRRSDLYSAGVCLYEMLLGLNPFDGLAPAELLALVTNPTFLERRPPEGLLPDRLAAVLRRALAVQAVERFQTAESFRDELLACQTELDANASEEALAEWMQQTFAREYAAERRLLKRAAEAWVPEGSRETGIYIAPGVHPTPDSVSARPTPQDDQARWTPSSQEVVPLSFAPVPRNREDPEVGMVADAPTAPGARYGEVETQPEVKLAGSPDSLPTPAVDFPAFARNPSPQAVPLPRLPDRSIRWVVAPLLGGLSFLAAYLCWDLYRTGFFRSGLPPERPSWAANVEAEPENDSLAPLVIGLSNGPPGTPLGDSFQQLRQQFTRFKHAFGCGGARAPLCRRYETLSADVQAALNRSDGHNEELLKRVRELGSDLTDARSGL
jgi:serine/threonine protein kinase